MVLCALLGFAGCHKKDPVSTDGTGVQGLDTPDQILSNPYVRDALDAASDEGVNITPEKGVKPPVISGTYDFTGQVHVQGYPGWHTLTPGTWKWSNQTSDNKIDTDYDQGMQTGGGVKGEIIRGTGNRFTVYSVLDISDEYCDERAIALIDGEQEDNGNIRANYIITPAADPVCHAPTIGYLELTLTGAAKAAVNESGGAFLMMILKDASSELHFNETNK
jgi:hypothetical protein